MGQGQSSADGSNGAPGEETTAKRDYYELLGVERTATEDELKKAYRRKALELHPDRNYGNVEEATQLFAEVQSAYEILSDPQERAWYDSHRDVLLRGDAPGGGEDGPQFSYNVKMTTAEEVLRLMLKFNGKLDYSDAPSGFYGGLREFFQKIAHEESIACQWEDLESPDYPEFGSKEDDYEDVVRPFYAAWAGFATRKSYAWKDQYRLSEAPDRRIRRLMEKENKKLRDEGIQEYNDALRSLVAFVRKRDPRVRNNQKSEAERQKALREAAAAQAARAKAARQVQNEELENYVLPEWAQSRTKDEHEGGFSSESDIEEHEYDCVVCDKTFKSDAQFKAHERSKKHIKSLKQLQREMRAEGKDLNLQGKSSTTADDIEIIDDEDEIPTRDTDNQSERGSQSELEPELEPDIKHTALLKDESETEEHQSWQATARSSNQPNPYAPSPDSTLSEAEGESDTDSDLDSDYAPRSQVADRLTSTTTTTTIPSSLSPSPPDQKQKETNLTTKLEKTSISNPDEKDTPQTSDLEGSSSATGPKIGKMGKAKQKRAKKAAAAATAGAGAGVGGEFSCMVCGNGFPSKTQLFDHIKEKNHAAPISQVKAAGGNGGNGGGKGGKGKRR